MMSNCKIAPSAHHAIARIRRLWALAKIEVLVLDDWALQPLEPYGREDWAATVLRAMASRLCPHPVQYSSGASAVTSSD